MFVAQNVADITTAVVVGISVPCIAAVIITALIVISYKLKNRYNRPL